MAQRRQTQKNDDPALQSVWRAALGKPDGLRLECQTAAEAKRLRFALYNSVRHLRTEEGARFADQELIRAVDNCSISFVDERVLLIQDNQFSPLRQVVQKALEQYQIPVKTATEEASQTSAQKVMEALAKEGLGEPPAGSTPVGAPAADPDVMERARQKANAYYGKQ